MIKLAFRLDDVSPTGDAVLEEKIFALFAKHCVELSVGVIPFRRDGSALTMISRDTSRHLVSACRRGGIEVALHGHAHISRVKAYKGMQTEFRGVGRAEQFSLISEGRAVLQKMIDGPVVGFIPPWNTYDGDTLNVLRELGFEYVSSSLAGGYVDGPGVATLPATTGLRNVREAVGQARAFSQHSPVVIAYFHPDDFFEYEEPPGPGERGPFTSLDQLEQLLCWVARCDEIRTMTLLEISRSLNGRQRLFPAGMQGASFLPHRFRRKIPSRLLFDSKAVSLMVRVKALVSGPAHAWSDDRAKAS